LPGDEFTVLQSDVTDLTYVVWPVTTGQVYSFKVRARNIEGYSEFSDPVSILAAQVPDAPTNPTTEFISNTVVVRWDEPFNRGSEILGYKIYL